MEVRAALGTGRTAVAEQQRPRELRWSARRKADAVIRLLRGEGLDELSRELRVEAHRLASWRDEFLAGGMEGLKARPLQPEERRLKEAERKNGELTMEVEVLRAAARKGGCRSRPGGGRGERRDRGGPGRGVSDPSGSPLDRVRPAGHTLRRLPTHGEAWAEDVAGLVHHSDRGTQYLSFRYTERLEEAGIAPSVGSVGDSYDNAMAESVIGLYKTGDPPAWTVEGHRRRRVRHARVGGLVQPSPAVRADRSRATGVVRGRLLSKGGLTGRRGTQRTEPPVKPGRFNLAGRCVNRLPVLMELGAQGAA